MKKGIDLQAKVHIGTAPSALTNLKHKLPELFAQANPGLTLNVKKVSDADSAGDATIRVYIEGEQDPAADFAALTRGALHTAVAAFNSSEDTGSAHSAALPPHAVSVRPPKVHIKDLKEMEGDEEDTGVTLPPQAASPSQAQPQASSPAAQAAPAKPAGSGAPVPADSPTAPPPAAQPPAAPPAPTAAAPTPWWAFWRRGNSG